MVIGFRVLAYVARGYVVRNEFPHSREVESALDHTEGPVFPPVTCDNGVMVSRNDFLDAVFGDDDFVVCPQSTVLEVMTFVVLEFASSGVEEVRENLGILTIVFHPVVENGVGWGDEAANNIGDREHGSIEFFRLSVLLILLKMSATMFVFPGMW